MSPWGSSIFTGLIRALGEPEFPRHLLDALSESACIGHISIIAFDDKLTDCSMAAESADRRTLAQTAGQIYEAARFYRHDPSAALIATHPDLRRPLLCGGRESRHGGILRRGNGKEESHCAIPTNPR